MLVKKLFEGMDLLTFLKRGKIGSKKLDSINDGEGKRNQAVLRAVRSTASNLDRSNIRGDRAGGAVPESKVLVHRVARKC